MGTRAQICILSLRSYLITWICSRRRKRSDKPWNKGSHKVKGGMLQSEEVIPLGYGKCRFSKYLGNLGEPPKISSNKNELQVRTKRIRLQIYLREKLLPPHLMHCSNFSGRIYVKKTPEQCNLNHYRSQKAREDA